MIQDCGEILTSNWDVCCRDGTADRLSEYPVDHQDDLSVSNCFDAVVGRGRRNVGIITDDREES